MNSFNNFANIIDKTNIEFIKNDLQPFLRIPSNTLNKEGILNAKTFLISYISDFCEEVTENPGEINPLIVAKVNGESEKFLLIYMMYDTQPVNPESEWISPSYAAEIHVLPPPLNILGNCIISRGAYNSKTPLLCFLNVVKELKKKEQLPFSLLLLFDGEEEIGSPTLLKMIDEDNKIFKGCQDAYYPAIKQNFNGKLVLKLGYKGIISLTIIVSSKNKEPHSAFSAMIPNPAAELISLLNNIYSDYTFQIESLREPYNLLDDEIIILNDLMKTLDFDKIKNKEGIISTRENNPKMAFKNYLLNPTFNISTLKSGFLGDGLKNYIPNKAMCNIDIRYAHNISLDIIFNEIKAKVEEFSKSSECEIELIKNIGYEGSRVKKDSILVQSLIKSSKTLGVQTELWPFSAAAAPLSKIQKVLGINFITGGLGIGGSAHSANEYVKFDSIINARLSFYHFLNEYSSLYKQEIHG